MKVTQIVKPRSFSTNILSSTRTISCLTALTMCIQGGFCSGVEAKSKPKKHIQNSIKKARYKKSRQAQITKLPFSQKDEVTDEESEKQEATKEKKPQQKDKDASTVIDDIDVIEIDQDVTDEKQEKSKSPKKEASPQKNEKDIEEVSQEPRLLPDNALISVLKDISKSLKSLDEELVSNPDEQLVIELARKILNKSLKEDGIEADRILKPEHENSARSRIVVEAWSSGDTEVDEDLKGSVAAVWGKRIDGILNVTIAGESKNQKSSDGKTVGKFIVIVSGKSPIKKGFDIQSQSDVTFWIGEVGKIDVDASCLTRVKTDKNPEDNSESKELDENASVKKKSLTVLSPILTDRKREYLALYVAYKNKLDSQTQKLKEEQEKAAEEKRLAEQKRLKEQRNFQFAKANGGTPYQFLPDEVEIIEIEEEALPLEDAQEISVDSDYDHVQEPDKKPQANKKKVKRTRRIRRIPRRFFESSKKDSQNQLSFRKKNQFQYNDSSIDKTEKNEPREEEENKVNKTDDAKNDTVEMEKDAAVSDEKLREDPEIEEAIEEPNSSKVTPAKNDREEVNLKDDNEDKELNKIETKASNAFSKTEKVESIDSKMLISKDNKDTKKAIAVKSSDDKSQTKTKTSIEQKNAQSIEDSKKEEVETKRIASSNNETKDVEEATSNKTREETDLAQKLASITKIAPIKPQQASSLPAPSTTPQQKWESPAQSIIMRQPSIGAKLIYPERALAGKFLTVSVIDKYSNPEPSVELSFNGATLSTDKNGQAMFMVPEDATPGRTLHVSLAARPELNPGVIEVLQPLFTTTETAAPTVDKASKLVPDTKTLVIDGHDFLGKAGNNKVLIDSKHEAKVIAASPVQLQLKLPKFLPCGKHKANVANMAKKSAPVSFEYIKATVVEGKKAKTKKNGDVIVKVKGTQTPVSVRVTNKTPKIVEIHDGNEVTVTTSGGVDNSSKVNIRRLKKGGFRIDAKIEI